MGAGMKSQTIKLHSKKQALYATNLITAALQEDELWCVEIKKYKQAKTLQQLRGLFGTWYDYLSETLGETKDDLHYWHKIGFDDDEGCQIGGWLRDIYVEKPQGKLQEMWVDHLNLLINKCQSAIDACLIGDHIKRISLSWATIDQMREYMNRIEQYYISVGYPLPILEKYRRWYQ